MDRSTDRRDKRDVAARRRGVDAGPCGVESDWSDEDLLLCELCEEDCQTRIDFQKEDYSGSQEGEGDRCAVCNARVVLGHVRTRTERKDVKIRWADECKLPLARLNPRKRYSKRPRPAPLKSILKGT